jgi:hypothetical protein
MRRLFSLLLLACAATVSAASLSDLTNTDAASGLKGGLEESAMKAVSLLGTENGFYGNPKLRIPLPPSMQKVEGAMRMMGMKKQADELVLSMNRAAEAAMPEAKALLEQSIKQMTVQDAKGILTGGDTAATEYFKRTTQKQLTERFLPIVKKTTEKVGLAQQYNSIAGQGAALGLVKEDQATVERYVTQKALDGLYTTIGEQEKALRANPVGATSDLVKKVFGAVK